MIHPTAIIHPEAQVDPSAEIGPYVIIDGPAKVGAGVKLEAHAQLVGDVTIGSGTTIGRAAIIGCDPQDLAFQPSTPSSVVIGEGNVIREQVTIHRGSKAGAVTRVGDKNFIMATVHFAHDVQIGNNNVIANAALFAGHVQMGNNCVIGGGSVFHQFLRVGSYCVAQGNGSFSKDIPPYCCAVLFNRLTGLNVIGLRRAGFNAGDRAKLKSLFDLVFRSGLNLTQARAEIAQQEWPAHGQNFIDFLNGPSRKGICRPRSRHESDDEE
ncbi:MAG: acyl-ACP--UDP-N-acetylglucosamine O-acyltransferase [Verrucomicrobiaceae bacterium]|nr:acyl-ACP--UDP-N-acetylglucosamine O-acyltransferase [Verrucomicrobiaceae bacterium]